ncbi:MAG: hypothetical protein ASARMPRED_001880 [Alectoria sarmentosa]|nr:MAG: hypothetical protein ASARMPRED_001880 [Alectoria sarmentosa]
MESDQSGKHVSLHAFKGDLELMVTKRQEETGAAISFDCKSLMGFIESSMPQRKSYVVEVPLVDYAGGLGPFFAKLPRELRDQIISDLLASGYPQFMSVSRAMNIEGKALIYKKGVYSMNFGHDVSKQDLGLGNANCPIPAQEVADSIQNISLAFDIRGLQSSGVLEPTVCANAAQHLDMVMGARAPRGTCRVFFEIYPVDDPTILWDINSYLRGLIGFDTVVLRIGVDMTYFPTSPHRLIPKRFKWFENVAFGIARVYLQFYLGKGEMGSDNDGKRLIFHPRRAR